MKKLVFIFLAALLCFSLSGCGANSLNGEKASDSYSTETAPGETPENSGVSLRPEATERKLIYTSEVFAETKDFDTAKAAVDGLISQYQGYLESSSFSGYSRGEEKEDCSLDYTIRIPAESLSDFLAELEDKVNVTSSNTYMEDVTGSYVDTEARLKSLRQEETRLLELLEQAESLEEILQLEDRLSNVRYEIESMTSQLQIYDDEIAYSTVNLSLRDVTEYTIRPSFGSRSWEAFTGGWTSFVNALQGFVLAFLWLLPFLIVIAVITVPIVIFTRRSAKKRRARLSAPPFAPVQEKNPPAVVAEEEKKDQNE